MFLTPISYVMGWTSISNQPYCWLGGGRVDTSYGALLSALKPADCKFFMRFQAVHVEIRGWAVT